MSALAKWLKSKGACKTRAALYTNVTGKQAFLHAPNLDKDWLMAALGINPEARTKFFTCTKGERARMGDSAYPTNCPNGCSMCLEIALRAVEAHDVMEVWYKETDGVTVYHLIMPDNTITFFTEDARADFIAGHPEGTITAESLVSIAEFEEMKWWASKSDPDPTQVVEGISTIRTEADVPIADRP